MTATITETVPRNVGDQVEVLYSGEWVPATISGECCSDHWFATVPGAGLPSRFDVQHIRAPQIPVYASGSYGVPSLAERMDAFDDSGIAEGDRIKVTMLSAQQSANSLTQAEHDGAQEWTFNGVDRSDPNRTFSITGTVDGERESRWVANVERWTENVSHGETEEVVWQVGDWVTFDFQGQTVFGQIVSVPINPPGQSEVASIGHGRLYPHTTEFTRPDPVEWARAYVAEGEAQGHHPAAVVEALTRFDEAQARIDAVATTKQEFLDNVQEVASRTANDEEWCEVADTGLRKLGLERVRDTPLTEDVGWSVSVTVPLERELDEDEVAEMLASHFEVDDEQVSGTYVTITGTADITVTGTCYEIEEGSCVCDSIGRSAIREQMPTWASNLSFDYDEVNCDNDN